MMEHLTESVTNKAREFAGREYHEGPIGRALEKQATKVPSDVFLWAALGSIIGSLAFQAFGKKDTSLFIGEWVPTFLMLGLYNKIVKSVGPSRSIV